MQHRVGLPEPQPAIQIARFGLLLRRQLLDHAADHRLTLVIRHPAASAIALASGPAAPADAGAVPLASSGTGTPPLSPPRQSAGRRPPAPASPRHVGQQRLPSGDRLQRFARLRRGRRQIEPCQPVARIGFQNLV